MMDALSTLTTLAAIELPSPLATMCSLVAKRSCPSSPCAGQHAGLCSARRWLCSTAMYSSAAAAMRAARSAFSAESVRASGLGAAGDCAALSRLLTVVVRVSGLGAVPVRPSVAANGVAAVRVRVISAAAGLATACGLPAPEAPPTALMASSGTAQPSSTTSPPPSGTAQQLGGVLETESAPEASSSAA